MYEEELKKLSDKMDKSIVALKNEFTSIRTGQANASLGALQSGEQDREVDAVAPADLFQQDVRIHEVAIDPP